MATQSAHSEFILERSFSVFACDQEIPDENSVIAPLPSARWVAVGRYERFADAFISGVEGERSDNHLETHYDIEYVYILRVVGMKNCIYRIRMEIEV